MTNITSGSNFTTVTNIISTSISSGRGKSCSSNPSQYLLVQSQQWKHQNNVWDILSK